MIKFLQAKLFHRSTSVSDHRPLSFQLVRKPKSRNYDKIFRFEAMWLKDESCEDVVKSAWEEGLLLGTEFPIQQYMANCKTKLELCNRDVFGHVGKKIADLKKQL